MSRLGQCEKTATIDGIEYACSLNQHSGAHMAHEEDNLSLPVVARWDTDHKDLYELLDCVVVIDSTDTLEDGEEPILGDYPPDWYLVMDEDGVIAGFASSVDAFRFRLDYINRRLNP